MQLFKDELIAKIKDALYKDEMARLMFGYKYTHQQAIDLLILTHKIEVDKIIEVKSVPDIDKKYFKSYKKIDKKRIKASIENGHEVNGVNVINFKPLKESNNGV